MLPMIILSFILFLVAMTGIGILSARKSKSTTTDYILASRDVGPVATSLSAVSTCHSGFMFIGMIGFTYTIGISAIWLIISWMIGDYVAWKMVYKRLRKQTEASNISTVSGFISHHFNHKKQRIIQWVSGSFILVFLAVYAAAQLTAGSKALNAMLGWPVNTGIVLGAVIVGIYSVAGGIRASIWTDVAQSIIMLCSMIGLVTVAIVHLGGLGQLFDSLSAINPSLVSLIPTNLQFGFPLYILGWVAFGLGVIGQPHIIVRPMAISSPNHIQPAMRLYLLWYLIFSICAIGVGLAARVILPELSAVDQELALPKMAISLLPSIFVGGILAGLFSATISTADSQVLTCSATITQDLFPKGKQRMMASKLATLAMMLVAMGIALAGSKNVYLLVVLGWSGLSVILGPLIVLQCFNIRLAFTSTLLMMLAPFATIMVWRQWLQLSGDINEVLPGIAVALMVLLVTKAPKKKPVITPTRK